MLLLLLPLVLGPLLLRTLRLSLELLGINGLRLLLPLAAHLEHEKHTGYNGRRFFWLFEIPW
jgi:hypothetical protein